MIYLGTEYVNKGVKLTSDVLIGGSVAEIEYNGLLANSGAHNIYMFWGYEDHWKSPGNTKMKQMNDRFIAEFEVTSNGKLNIAFKDSANNWDNNSGENYKFKVH